MSRWLAEVVYACLLAQLMGSALWREEYWGLKCSRMASIRPCEALTRNVHVHGDANSALSAAPAIQSVAVGSVAKLSLCSLLPSDLPREVITAAVNGHGQQAMRLLRAFPSRAEGRYQKSFEKILCAVSHSRGVLVASL